MDNMPDIDSGPSATERAKAIYQKTTEDLVDSTDTNQRFSILAKCLIELESLAKHEPGNEFVARLVTTVRAASSDALQKFDVASDIGGVIVTPRQPRRKLSKCFGSAVLALVAMFAVSVIYRGFIPSKPVVIDASNIVLALERNGFEQYDRTVKEFTTIARYARSDSDKEVRVFITYVQHSRALEKLSIELYDSRNPQPKTYTEWSNALWHEASNFGDPVSSWSIDATIGARPVHDEELRYPDSIQATIRRGEVWRVFCLFPTANARGDSFLLRAELEVEQVGAGS